MCANWNRPRPHSVSVSGRAALLSLASSRHVLDSAGLSASVALVGGKRDESGACVMEELNLDQDFLMQFSCMGTQDKDVLVSELHGILDSQLSREGCAFFLDMTNW